MDAARITKSAAWLLCQRLTAMRRGCYKKNTSGGAVAQLGARLDGIEEVVGSNPIGSTMNPSLIS